MNQNARGFTIVELLIVIVVIAILATLSYVGYTTIYDRANDSKMEDGAAQFIKALSLWSVDNGVPFNGGGYGSTLPLTDGKCPDGSGNGFVATPAYECTISDTLVASGHLSTDFMRLLPKNIYHGGADDGLRSIMMYRCGSSNSVMVLWTLRRPSTEETASLHDVMSNCGYSSAGQIISEWGMRSARIVSF